MNRQDIIDRLRENEAALKARGVTHAALFGSRARCEERRGSDIDILIDIDPGAPVGVWEYAGLKRSIASLFDGPVDVVDRGDLRILTQSGQGFRFDVGHRSDLIPATIPK